MKYLFIFLISLFFLGCEEKILPTGNFYDGATSRSVYGEIRQLDFTTGKVEVISAKDVNISSMSKIFKVNNEKLIFNARMKFIKGIGAKHYIYIIQKQKSLEDGVKK